jgi:ferredoxin
MMMIKDTRMTDWDTFSAQFGVWPVAKPYAKVMFDEQEVRLVIALGDHIFTVDQIALALCLDLKAASELVDRCYHRSILDRQAGGFEIAYRTSNFYSFLDYFIKYGNWDDIPASDRQAIDHKYLQEFIASVKERVALKLDGKATPDALPNDSVMLLPEVEAMIDAASIIVVQPCDCRRSAQSCKRPVETCLWLDDAARSSLERGYGRILSQAEARQLLRQADKKGLMHTADSEWRERGLHVICNCCACDCFPFRASVELESKGVWPRSRYLADYNATLCSQCGACVKRCHFNAFFHDGSLVKVNGENKKTVSFDPQKCWGCGLCANTCPKEAIEMLPIDRSIPN